VKETFCNLDRHSRCHAVRDIPVDWIQITSVLAFDRCTIHVVVNKVFRCLRVNSRREVAYSRFVDVIRAVFWIFIPSADIYDIQYVTGGVYE
jgi:hypothetical protein